ncbi:SAV_915 family protein [Streptomyces sp. NPDC008139]|uniref:SAV_915 family protein n=1 Tax=Streptomyces sp. NPDC008139 TaxID=3364814 RepID=UPI0036E99216
MHVSQHDGPGDRTPEGQPHEQTIPATARETPLGPVSPTAESVPVPEGPLYVPVRQGPAGYVVRLWRTPVGSRTAVAFTSDQRLRSVLGPTQPWIKLSESALRAMAEPLGARHLTVDPLLTARPPASWTDPAAGRPCPRRGTDGVAAGAAEEDEGGDGIRQQPAGLAP